MKCICTAAVAAVLFASAGAAGQPSAADLSARVAHLSIDPDQTYRVRDLQFSRGDIKIYLNEGVLSFAAPVDGHGIAALFTAEESEAGDGEMILLPPQRSERASLALFTKSPNLDEHFTSAVFLFSDQTRQELLSQIEQALVRKLSRPELHNEETWNTVLRAAASEAGIRVIESLLDRHRPEEGFFYSFVAGRDLGTFELFYDPTAAEPIAMGRAVAGDTHNALQLWTSFRPRHVDAVTERPPVLSDYRINITVRPDLSVAAVAKFGCVTGPNVGRALALGLSEHLRVKSARIDDNPVEVFQPEVLHLTEEERGRTFLLIPAAPLTPDATHAVEIHYEGSLIHDTGHGGYFVDERNAWYPQVPPIWSNFDLTFRIDPKLTLVSTGELVSDEVVNGVRVVHRRTSAPEGLAGFNLGNYKSKVEEHGPYRVELYAHQESAESVESVIQKTESVLDFYTRQWTQLPIHALAVTPIAGTFGQGFPGLIYLSSLAYMRPEDRPATLRNARLDTFFSEMMLSHEVAHQWWGNVVLPSTYRTAWLLEAMSNYSALQVLENTQGSKAVNVVLESYRQDLMGQQNGKRIESFGPVDFGVRLVDTAGIGVWHTVVYEKGSWILHMLRQRLGDEGFRRMQLRLLEDFRAKPITNEDFRKVVSQLLPPGQPDKDLSLFFDAWVYGTGIPRLSILRTHDGDSLVVSAVDEDFTADIPVRCHGKSDKQEQLRWIRVGAGPNPINTRSKGVVCELPSSSEFLYYQ